MYNYNQQKKIEKLGLREFKLREYYNTIILKTLLRGLICALIGFFFPVVSLYIPYAIVKIIIVGIKYLLESEYTILGKRKRGR